MVFNEVEGPAKSYGMRGITQDEDTNMEGKLVVMWRDKVDNTRNTMTMAKTERSGLEMRMMCC